MKKKKKKYCWVVAFTRQTHLTGISRIAFSSKIEADKHIATLTDPLKKHGLPLSYRVEIIK